MKKIISIGQRGGITADKVEANNLTQNNQQSWVKENWITLVVTGIISAVIASIIIKYIYG